MFIGIPNAHPVVTIALYTVALGAMLYCMLEPLWEPAR